MCLILGTLSEEERELIRQAAKERAEIVARYDKVSRLWMCTRYQLSHPSTLPCTGDPSISNCQQWKLKQFRLCSPIPGIVRIVSSFPFWTWL